ncbi:hypothetical protein LPN01_03430 [Sphingomonas sp. A2-49]|uniref:hypothetical protein n=1 Tax=Sphingomonas sp. A2-49 TaxID=1391375 RepID=UPI0021D1BD73|nr:hypothetical protein [Sphingomonas sp. A2-49]MCU6453125.1 hypothetical protein [Sphingomonas sp. A2-49]
MSKFEMLLSADMMVPDPDAMTDLLVSKLGIHSHPKWRQAFDNHPYIAHFLRVQKSLAIAPTRIEPQVHLDRPNPGDPLFHDHLKGLERFQGRHRPMLTHSVVLVAWREKMEALIERLHDRKLRFRLAQRTPEMPFDRLWLGVTPEDLAYDPSVDGGLCIEFIPLEPTQMPAEVFDVPPPRVANPAPGELLRVTARGFLVRDLDFTIGKLRDNLDWEPEQVDTLPGEGYRRARMGFTIGHSAALDIVEPTRWDSPAGLYLNSWGPGPYFIRLGAFDLAAKADQLKEQGIAFQWVPESDAVGGGPLIRIDPRELDGQIFEIEGLAA